MSIPTGTPKSCKSLYPRTIDVGALVDSVLETNFADEDKKPEKTNKRVGNFHSQVVSGVRDMKVRGVQFTIESLRCTVV